MKNIQRTLVLGASIVALAGCGADEIVSPGANAPINVDITNPPAPTPTPTPTQTLVTPADRCPQLNSSTQLLDQSTITGPTGTYRVCQLPALFDADDQLPKVDGLVYRIFGQVSVGNDLGFAATAGENSVELTVEPGVIFMATNRSFLVVQRGNKIFANGTATDPIIWTSTQNVKGDVNDDSQQLWGGVVLLGRATVSDCRDGANTPAAPNAQCEGQLEGTDLTTLYGGNDDADSSGSFTFNQIRFSGFELAPDSELQSLTTGGIGSGTTINNLQTFNSSDDGMEFFGGTFNAKNIAVIGASDDSLDVDSGARVNLDTVLVAQRSTTGDHMIELDSGDGASNPDDAIPQTRLQLNNFTFIQGAGRDTAISARGNAALGLTNGVMSIQRTTDSCFLFAESNTVASIIGFNSVVANCGADPIGVKGTATEAGVQAALDADANNDFNFTLSLVGGVNGANENGVTAFAATARSAFFVDRAFVGAEDNNIADNFGDWTCNSATFDFGSANGSCLSLPGA